MDLTKKIIILTAFLFGSLGLVKAQENSGNEILKTYKYLQKDSQEYSIEKKVKMVFSNEFKEIGTIKKEDLDYWKGKEGFTFTKGDTTYTIHDGREILIIGNEEYNTTLIDYDHCLGVEEIIIKNGNKSLEITKVKEIITHFLNGRTGDENPSGQEIQNHYINNSWLFRNFLDKNNLPEKIRNYTGSKT